MINDTSGLQITTFIIMCEILEQTAEASKWLYEKPKIQNPSSEYKEP